MHLNCCNFVRLSVKTKHHMSFLHLWRWASLKFGKHGRCSKSFSLTLDFSRQYYANCYCKIWKFSLWKYFCGLHKPRKKKKNTKYILQRIIIIARTFFFAQFQAQLASYFARDSLFDTSISLELMANMRQLFTQCPINCLSLLPQYVATELFGSLLHASSLVV